MLGVSLALNEVFRLSVLVKHRNGLFLHRLRDVGNFEDLAIQKVLCNVGLWRKHRLREQ